ncbi:MAG: serine protease [Holophagaceae bacterium]|nr:serine protease [Holophagaceae bacterium]
MDSFKQRIFHPTSLLAFVFWTAALFGQEVPAPALSVVKVVADQGHGSLRQGSGVMVGPGLVATNAHVTAGALSVSILSGPQTWQVQSRKEDLRRDLSLLAVPGLSVPVAPPAPAAPSLGQPVTAIGFPSGQGPKVSAGRITGLWAYLGAEVVQSDAPTAPGSSGGGLFDAQGRLLGLTTFIFAQSRAIHFSVPVRWIRDLMDDPMARAATTAIAPDLQMPGFLDTLASNPANQPAWDAFTRIWVQNSPGDPDAWFAYANSLEPGREPQRIQERIAAYGRALELRSESPKAWNNLGASLGLVNRFPEAEAAFRQALALSPRYGLALLNLGALLLDMRRSAEAAETLAQGLEQLPDNAEGWEHLGEAWLSLGRPAEAVRHYRTALGLSPFRTEWWADLARACDKAHDEPGVQQALGRLSALDASQARTLAKELKRQAVR